jgi:glycerophosphoryl diester phosphodiesterase
MYKRLTTAIVATVATMLALPSVAAHAHDEDEDEQPTLVGRAVLPADTLGSGPPSGAALGTGVINGIEFPRPRQAVGGFSAVVAGRQRGEYLVMPDNGFGTKANSRDFLIRAYYARPDFKTARGGSGTVEVDTEQGEFIAFRDPHHLIGFPIVNEGTSQRLLAGGDIDPESLQRGARGDLWVGDEFGPWILHFDATGELLDPPFATPGGLMSPSNPFLGADPPTQPNSRGYEAMAINPKGTHLYAALEGATVAETGSTRRQVFEFSVRDEAFTGRVWSYRTEQPGHMVADMWALDGRHLAVIERDAGRGLDAIFRRVYVADLRRTDASGSLVKSLAVDLAAVPDPDLVSLPEIHAGDVGLGNPFRVTCESVEAIHQTSASKLLIGCDNNLPNTGRNPSIADDTELIVVRVPDLDDRD